MRIVILALICSVGIMLAQQGTRISLRDQGKIVDFTDMQSVKPFPTANTAPATCAVGEVYFNLSMAPGQNIFICESENTWTQQGGNTEMEPGLKVTRTSNTVLSIGAECSAGRPCLVRTGTVLRAYSVPTNLTLAGGSGTAYIYVSGIGNLTVGTPTSSTLNLTCQSCDLATNVPSFPVDSIPIYIWSSSVTAGVWDTAGLDQRATLSSAMRVLGGNNITVTETGTTVSISSTNFMPDGAVINDGGLALTGTIPVSASESLLRLGSALTGASTNGTMLGIQTASTFSGDFAHWMQNGASRYQWKQSGEFSANLAGGQTALFGNSSAAAGSSFRLALGGTASTNELRIGAGSSSNFLLVNGLGKVALGTTAPDPDSADLLIQDSTATIGSTQVQIKAGAGQNRDMLQIVDTNGEVMLRIGEQAGLQLCPTKAKPACAVENRGMFWFSAAIDGEADTVEICAKNAMNEFSWKALL